MMETTVDQFITNVATGRTYRVMQTGTMTKPLRLCFQSLSLARALQTAQGDSCKDLSSKIGVSLQPIFTSKKIGDIIKTCEQKPKIINEQCVVYHFKCGLAKSTTFVLLIDTFFNASTNTPTQDL